MLKWLPMMAFAQVACWQLLTVRAVANVTVSDVEIVGVENAEPFDRKVTVKYRLAGTYDRVNVTFIASADSGINFDVPVNTVSGDFGFSGSTTSEPVTTDGTMTVTWNIGADWPGERSNFMKFRVRADSLTGGFSEASSTATSEIFRADTRPIQPLTMKRTKKTTGDGRQLITYESAVTGVPAGEATVYYQAALPDSDPQGGGVFYGYELMKFSDNIPAKLYYAIGRDSLDPSRQDLVWRPTSFDTLLRIPLNGKLQTGRNIYFKIVRSGAAKALRIRLRAKFACFYDKSGKPITGLNPEKDIVLVFHGRSSGEKKSRPINAAMRRAGDTKQVVSVDWSSGAASSGLELTGGRYLRNLGGALRERLGAEGFTRRQITTVGHSWGALLSHEVATSWDSGVARMYVLDPAPAADSYNEKRVNFGVRSKCGQTYGIKGGNRNDGVFGSPNMTRTCQWAVNVLSRKPPSDLLDRWHFYHNLPVDWFIRAISGGQPGLYKPDKPKAYWDYARGALIENQLAIPKEIGESASAPNEFNLVCNGTTTYDSKRNIATFVQHTSFEFKLKDKGWRYVTQESKPNGEIRWNLLGK